VTGLATLLGPLVALTVVGGLAFVLRWAFSRGGSVVAPAGRRGGEHEYGLLVPVASPQTSAQAQLMRRRLERHGLRVTVTETDDGPRLLVFADDADAAASVLAEPGADDTN
jgi:hypothetical protein